MRSRASGRASAAWIGAGTGSPGMYFACSAIWPVAASVSRRMTEFSRTPMRNTISVPQVLGPPAVIAATTSAMLAPGGIR